MEHANPDYAIELPKSRATTAVTTDGMALVAVWSDESWALIGQTKEALQALMAALSPGRAGTLKQESITQAATLWSDILRMADAAKLMDADMT